jgi:hypothetical protein
MRDLIRLTRLGNDVPWVKGELLSESRMWEIHKSRSISHSEKGIRACRRKIADDLTEVLE